MDGLARAPGRPGQAALFSPLAWDSHAWPVRDLHPGSSRVLTAQLPIPRPPSMTRLNGLQVLTRKHSPFLQISISQRAPESTTHWRGKAGPCKGRVLQGSVRNIPLEGAGHPLLCRVQPNRELACGDTEGFSPSEPRVGEVWQLLSGHLYLMWERLYGILSQNSGSTEGVAQ